MNGSLWLALLPWVLPPFLGAVIGYVTNALAIRMLFRPLTEKRFFGIKLPLTPGIIPKQRRVLAENIGQMVAEQLITEEALQSQIASPGFQEGINQNIASLTAGIINTPLGSLMRDNFPELYGSLQTLLAGTLRSIFRSGTFMTTVRSLLSSVVGTVAGSRLDELVDPEHIMNILRQKLYPLLTGVAAEAWCSRSLKGWLKNHLEKNTPIDILLSEDLAETGAMVFQALLPDLLDSLFKWLKSESMRTELEIRGRFLLRDILDKLNYLQKIFISVGQYDRTLGEKMPEIIEEVLLALEVSLRDPEVQNGLVRNLGMGLRKWQGRGISDVISAAGIDPDQQADRAIARIFDYLRNSKTWQGVSKSIRELLNAKREATLRDLARDYLGIQEEDMVAFLCSIVSVYVSKPDSPDRISGSVIRLVSDSLSESRAGTLNEILCLDETKKAKVDGFISVRFQLILSERLPSLVRSFRIKELVVSKINQLDVAQVESLLLMVIEKHLKWINIFGAILGALIGFSQVLLTLLNLI